jgi:hypothetical protein
MLVSSTWPNPDKVDYCGEKIKDRECNEMSKKPVDVNAFHGKFCFTPLEECPRGYHIDHGDVFGPHAGDIEYGWGRDVKSNARARAS